MISSIRGCRLPVSQFPRHCLDTCILVAACFCVSPAARLYAAKFFPISILNISRVHYNTKYHMPQYEAGTRIENVEKELE